MSLKLWGRLKAASVLAVGISSLGDAALARPVPDETLGGESSRVIDRSERDFDIDGGARRGRNLFHSFREFGVDDGGSVYFLNPNGVENIFSRVTGTSRSDILGTLGVRGNANLFLMNPNGILFGPNASLDVGGSFIGTTANAVGFGDEGFFGATNPQAVQEGLLTVNPSSFLFNQISTGNLATITNQASNGLQVPNGQSLILLGGNIDINGGGIIASGGRVELGGLADVGEIEIHSAGKNQSLVFPENSTRTDVSLVNRSGVIVAASEGGELVINARNISISQGSFLQAGILPNTGSTNSQAGSIVLNVSGVLTVSDSNTRILNSVGQNAIGVSGNVTIQADQLVIRDGAQVATTTSQGGQGNSGSILVNANESVQITGKNSAVISFLGSEVSTGASGNAGNIIIQAPHLNITNSQVASNLFGNGNAGNIQVHARHVEISGSGQAGGTAAPTFLASTVQQGGVGNAGNLTIETRHLSIQDGAQVLSSTFGMGNAGILMIRASNSIEIDGGSATDTGLFTQVGGRVGELAEGNVGDLIVETGRLILRNGGQINATIFGTGRNGILIIRAPIVRLIGTTNIPGRTGIQPSAIQTRIEPSGRGEAADLIIETEHMSIENGARVASDIEQGGRGQVGNILIRGDLIEVINASEKERLTSRVTTVVARGANGQGGDISIDTDRLLVRGGVIAASTLGQGDAGNLRISALESILLVGEDPSAFGNAVLAGGLFTRVRAIASGNGGDIRITTGSLNVRDGSQIQTATLGTGDAGNIFIRATQINLLDTDKPNTSPTGLFAGSQVEPLSRVLPIGDGGDIRVQTNSLNLNRSSISSTNSGQGRTGSIAITATDGINLRNNSSISNRIETGATGNSQRITLNTPNLSLREGSMISAATDGSGSAGDIWIQGASRVFLTDSTISTQVQENASVPPETVNSRSRTSSRPDRQGNITIDANSLFLNNGAQITASTNGRGRAGNVTIRDAQILSLDGESTISSEVQSNGRGRAGNVTVRDTQNINLNDSTISTEVRRDGRGQGGNIILNAEALNLNNNAQISARTNGRGRAGNITVNADRLQANSGGQLLTSTNTAQRAGNITLNELDSIILNGRGSGISANTNSSGQGGEITIDTNNLTLTDRATISSASRSDQQDGNAGDIRITATGALQANNGDIVTTANSSSGGDITLTGGNIRLRGGSDIRTNSQINGGNITVNADSLIAYDDSDIIAAAAESRGGNINFGNTIAFFENYDSEAVDADAATLEDNNRADINATGNTPGIISLPDTSFIQNSLSDLPTNSIDTDQLLANSCIARRTDGSTFLFTGRGSLPERPGAQQSEYPTGEVRAIPQSESRDWRQGDPFVEPQGAYRLPNGQVILSRECQDAQ